MFISVNDTEKRQLPLIAVRLEELGFRAPRPQGTASVLRRYGIESNIVDKISTRWTPIRKPRSRCITLPDPWAERGSAHRGRQDRHDPQHAELALVPVPTATPSVPPPLPADLPQFTTITEFQAALPRYRGREA